MTHPAILHCFLGCVGTLACERGNTRIETKCRWTERSEVNRVDGVQRSQRSFGSNDRLLMGSAGSVLYGTVLGRRAIAWTMHDFDVIPSRSDEQRVAFRTCFHCSGLAASRADEKDPFEDAPLQFPLLGSEETRVAKKAREPRAKLGDGVEGRLEAEVVEDDVLSPPACRRIPIICSSLNPLFLMFCSLS